jgi:nucleotidyltransferase/DNA polymerase involved in DNA repair
MAAQPPKYLGASSEISDILTDFTHLIEPEELWLYPSSANQKDAQSLTGWNRASGRSLPARFSLDLESLPPSEAQSLAKEIGSSVRQHTRLSPAVGLAENPFAAHVAATLTQPNHARTILPGDEAHFLSSQTVHFLPLEKESARRLSMLGIRTLGQLAALPKSTLYAQFGSEFASIYQMAQGYVNGTGLDVFAPLRPLAQEKRERVVHNFEEPISNLLILERVISRLASHLAGRLQAAKLEARTIRLSMEVENSPSELSSISSPHPIPQMGIARIGTPAALQETPGIFTAAMTRRYPTSALQCLEESFKELLHKAWRLDEKTPLGEVPSPRGSANRKRPGEFGGVLALAIELKDLSPAVSLQQLLFSRLDQSEESSGSKDKRSRSKQAVQSIAARHGREFFYQPVLSDVNHPLPERRFQMRELVPG